MASLDHNEWMIVTQYAYCIIRLSYSTVIVLSPLLLLMDGTSATITIIMKPDPCMCGGFLIAKLVCQRAYSVYWQFGVSLWDPDSCIQQRKTTSLLPIQMSLACARASELTTYTYIIFHTFFKPCCSVILSFDIWRLAVDQSYNCICISLPLHLYPLYCWGTSSSYRLYTGSHLLDFSR